VLLGGAIARNTALAGEWRGNHSEYASGLFDLEREPKSVGEEKRISNLEAGPRPARVQRDRATLDHKRQSEPRRQRADSEVNQARVAPASHTRSGNPWAAFRAIVGKVKAVWE
jgi:hypothetical protein